MSSLEACIRKAGKALRKEDADAIRKIRDDIYGVGDVSRDAANHNAVEEYIQIIDEERDAVVNQIEESGGVIADRALAPSDFAEQTGVLTEEESRRFPRVGMQREKDHRVDMLGMSPEDLHNILNQFDPELAAEMLKAHGGMAALRPLTGQARMNAIDVYVENIEPFLSDRIPLRYAKDLFGKDIPEPVEKKVEPVETQEDMFGDVTKEQRLADYERKKDLARDVGQEEIETGEVGDMFSEAVDQVDLEEAIVEARKKGNNLKYKVDDLFERENVDANPDTPIAVLTKHGAAMQHAAETAKPPERSFRRFVDRLISGDMTIEGVLLAVPQSKLKDFIRWGLDGVQDYVKTVKHMDAYMNGIMEGHAELGKKWLAFNNASTTKEAAKLLGEFMHASSLAGVDPLEYQAPDAATFKKMSKLKRQIWRKRAIDHKILMPFWEKLGEAGEQVEYTKKSYNPKTDRFVDVYTTKVSEAQAIYLEVRDTYGVQRSRVLHGLEERIKQTEAEGATQAELITRLRREFEQGQIVPYFPLSRFGKYWVYAKDPETDELVGFFKREKRSERNDLVKQLQDQGFVAWPAEESETDYGAVNRVDPNFVAKVESLLVEQDIVYTDKETGEKTIKPGREIADEIWQMYLQSLPEMSARKAYIHRKGRLGFTHDALRSYGFNTFHGTHQLAKLKYGYQLNDLLNGSKVEADFLLQRAAMIENMEKLNWRPDGYEEATMHEVMMAPVPEVSTTDYAQLYEKFRIENGTEGNPGVDQAAADKAQAKIKSEAEHDGKWAVPVVAELGRRHDYTMNPKSARWATNMTSLGFLWFLSTSPAAGVLNLTQTAISAYPILRARFRNAGAGVALWKAAGEYSVLPFSTKVERVDLYINKLHNDVLESGEEAEDHGERAALQYFKEIGMFTKTRMREMMGFAERGAEIGTKTQKALELTGWIFHKSEEMNRVVTAMAAYRLARKKFGDMSDEDAHELAIEQADEMVEKSHYDYTNTNRPRFMQGDGGRVVFLFRNYSLNMQYRLIRDFRDGVWKNKNIPAEDRIEARQRFAGIIMMTSMFAGLSGWPLMYGARFLLDTMLGNDDEPYDSRTALRVWLSEMWGDTVSEAIVKGPWDTITQTTLSSRASLNNLWIREQRQNLTIKELMSNLVIELAGPLMGMGMNYAQGFSDFQTSEYRRGFERMVPKAVADVMKTIRFAQQGAQTYQKDMIMSPAEFTNWDLAAQAMGFTPANLTLRYEQNRAIKDMESRLVARRTHILNSLFAAYKLGDRARAREVMGWVHKWNRVQPYKIDPKTILRSAQTRAAYDMRTIAGVAVQKRLQYLQSTMRFSERPKR